MNTSVGQKPCFKYTKKRYNQEFLWGEGEIGFKCDHCGCETETEQRVKTHAESVQEDSTRMR